MSYAASAALQASIYRALCGDAALAALVGPEVHDSVPPGPVPGLYVALGPEIVRDRSDASGAGAEHEIVVSVISAAAGFAGAKAAAGAVTEALVDADLSLDRGRLVYLVFHKARARHTGTGRRIDLTFRARTEAD